MCEVVCGVMFLVFMYVCVCGVCMIVCMDGVVWCVSRVCMCGVPCVCGLYMELVDGKCR